MLDSCSIAMTKGISFLHLFSLSLITVLITTSALATPEQCYGSFLEKPSCQWYQSCLEEKFKCGSEGYPIGLGFKYCSKSKKWFTLPEAQEWNKRSTRCLMNQLLPYLKADENISCQQLSKRAYRTHAHCYSEGGFCELFLELGFSKSLVFLKELVSIYELKDITLSELASHGFELSSLCIDKWVRRRGQEKAVKSEADF